MTNFNYRNYLTSWESLVTSYEQTRAGFIAFALEKNRKATPFIEEAKALKSIALKVKEPIDLINVREIRTAILTASGISDKAKKYLTEHDQDEAIKGLIENFLEPAGKDFIDELIYRFLLTRGDSLGGSMRNLAGALAERKMTRMLIAILSIQGISYSYLHSKSKNWIVGSKDDADVELFLKGLSWQNSKGSRTLIYNLTVPIVKKNVDLCLFNAKLNQFILGNNKKSCHYLPSSYIALGELKGGIDPAGADEHWKTANSALNRIRKAFLSNNLHPNTFFVGAAIEKAMAEEIFIQLETKQLSNAANLTDDTQLVSLCEWLITL